MIIKNIGENILNNLKSFYNQSFNSVHLMDLADFKQCSFTIYFPNEVDTIAAMKVMLSAMNSHPAIFRTGKRLDIYLSDFSANAIGITINYFLEITDQTAFIELQIGHQIKTALSKNGIYRLIK